MTRGKDIIGILHQIRHFLNFFGSLEGQNVSVGSSKDYP
jgi:hypothetical protein